MRKRLVSDELVALYASGESDNLSPTAIRRFFGVVEAVEGAATDADLFALRSLGPIRSRRDNLLFPLEDELVLTARRERDRDGTPVIALVEIERTGT